MNDAQLRAKLAEHKSPIINTIESDPDFVEIGDLPSKYIMYDFKKIMARGFRVPELRLIAKAAANNDIYYLIRAVDLVLDVDVNLLTIPDFYYILYWLRIESYPNTPLYMPWKCDNEVQVEKNGKKVPDEFSPCDYDNISPLHKTDLRIVYIDEGKDYDKLPEGLDYPRVSLLPSIDYKDIADSDRLLYDIARWVAGGEDIDSKLATLEKQTNNNLWEAAIAVNKRISYGVKEGATVTCERCSVERYYRIAINAATFLP